MCTFLYNIGQIVYNHDLATENTLLPPAAVLYPSQVAALLACARAFVHLDSSCH